MNTKTYEEEQDDQVTKPDYPDHEYEDYNEIPQQEIEGTYIGEDANYPD